MPERAAHLVDFIGGNAVFLEVIFPLAHDVPVAAGHRLTNSMALYRDLADGLDTTKKKTAL